MLRTIEELIEAAGGWSAIADASKGSLKEIKYDAVRRWPDNGIRDVHWPVLMRLVPDLTLDELYRANLAARSMRAKAKESRQVIDLEAGVA